MSKQICLSFLFNALILPTCLMPTAIADIINFDELTLDPNSYFDGYGSGAVSGSWSSGGAAFNTNQFGPGWSYSNVNDTTTAGFNNQWAAYTGTGVGGSGNYALVNSFSPNGATIELPDQQRAKSVWITNTTYAALSMRDGDSFAKKFGGSSGDDPDFFKLIVTGFSEAAAAGSETGSVEFYLADYRFNDNALDYILDEWVELNLTAVGNARSLAIAFESSDVGQFGINTPTYAAFDSLSVTSVPEPNSCLMLAWIPGILLFRRRHD